MIIHIDTMRDPDGTANAWLGIHTHIVGFMLTEHTVTIADQPERMLAVITNIGHGARAIEHNGQLKNNKLILQDDRELATGAHEQFEIFEMLADRRKKLLAALGGNYAKYLSAVISLKNYWQISIGLMSNNACVNCAMSLEVYKDRCSFCGERHKIKWQ